MRRKMVATKRLAKPTPVFRKGPKKPESDDTPGKMRGGMSAHRKKKLAGKTI